MENGARSAGRFQYTGQAWLDEVGLAYYKARMYSPTLGRFMQSDPIGYADGLNLYAYAGNDPVNATDPSGLCVRVGNYPPYNCPSTGHIHSLSKSHRVMTPEQAISFYIRNVKKLPCQLFNACDRKVAKKPKQQSGPCAVPGPRNVLNKAIAEANAKRLDSLRRINEAIRNFGTKEAYPIVQGINIETSLWFIERVRTGGVWDFKNQPGTRGNQDFGNFAFGATGDALGYGDFSHVGADLYSLYDNGTFEDQDAMIDRGQAYYRNGCQGR